MSAPRRQTPLPPQLWSTGRPVAARLMVAVLAGWGAAQAMLWAFDLQEVWQMFALDAGALRDGEYWRLLTSQLFHVNVAHFAANVVILFLAGREVEPIIGRRPFIGLCFSAGILGGLVNCAAAPTVAMSGSSAMVAAVIAAYATILPELAHHLCVFLPKPVRFRAKHLAGAVVLLAAICLVTGYLLPVGPAGIVLGAGLGWLWSRQLGFGNPFWFQRRKMERRQLELRRLRMTAEDFIAQEIDPILEKISGGGLASLTREERRILEEGRGRLARRGR